MIRHKIIKIRQNKELNQTQFGKILNLTPDQMSRIERGKQEVDLKTLIGLAQHFDVNLHELITNEVQNIPNDERNVELETENKLMRELLNLKVAEKKVG